MKRKPDVGEKMVKITIPLTVSSVELMKRLAKKRGTTHQKLISKVLERHAQTA